MKAPRSLVAGLLAGGLAACLFAGAASALEVGQKAPDFTLADTNGKTVSLSELLTRPIEGKAASSNPKGVLLIFYRGYW